MKRTSRMRKATIAFAVLSFSAALAAAQNADPNTAAPTKNDYRLRVLEPAEGAKVSGTSVRVAVSTAVPGQTREAPETYTGAMPRPQVLVFLDDQNRGELKDDQNVLTIDNVPSGPHKLVVLAKNRSGEVIDRKEIRFTSAPESAASAAPATMVEPQPAAPPEPPPAPPTTAVSERPTTSSAPSASAPPAPRARTLPKTGSPVPLLALAGLGLVLAGNLLRGVR